MKTYERTRGLLRAPRLIWDVLVRGRYAFVYDRIPITAGPMGLGKRLNLLRSGGNLVHRRLHPWSMPLHMQFELASTCNLRCPVCPTGRREVTRSTPFLDPALFERVLQDVGPTLLTASLWGWGEPLLHPQLGEILRLVGRHPVTTFLSTNGQRLADPRVQAALRSHPPSQLIVALDGITDETNARFRTGARLEPALEGVRQLAAWKRETGAKLPVLHMRTIIMKHNEHELPLLDDFARKGGFDVLSLRTLSIIDNPSPDQMVGNLVPGQETWQAYAYQDGARVRRTDFICQEPFWFPTLLSDGTVVACEQDFNAQHPMGKMTLQKSFSEIWRSEQAKSVRKLIRDDGARVSFCRNCPYADRAGSDSSVEFRRLAEELGP